MQAIAGRMLCDAVLHIRFGAKLPNASMMRHRRVFKLWRIGPTEKNGVDRPLRKMRTMDSSELIEQAIAAFSQGKPVMVFDSDFCLQIDTNSCIIAY